MKIARSMENFIETLKIAYSLRNFTKIVWITDFIRNFMKTLQKTLQIESQKSKTMSIRIPLPNSPKNLPSKVPKLKAKNPKPFDIPRHKFFISNLQEQTVKKRGGVNIALLIQIGVYVDNRPWFSRQTWPFVKPPLVIQEKQQHRQPHVSFALWSRWQWARNP